MAAAPVTQKTAVPVFSLALIYRKKEAVIYTFLNPMRNSFTSGSKSFTCQPR